MPLASIAAKFRDNVNGSMMPLFALSLTALLGAAGAAVDYSRASQTRADLQAALDGAVLAGASTFTYGAQPMIDTATKAFGANYPVQAGNPPKFEVSGTRFTGIAKVDVKTTLLNSVGFKTIPISVKSSAVRAGGQICMYVLDKLGTSLLLNSGSKLTMDCGIQVNSTAALAVLVNANSHIKATSLCVAGGTLLNGGSILPLPKLNCASAPDPLASLPLPREGNDPCKYQSFVLNNKSDTLKPGVYCGGIILNSKAHATLEPGVYVIRDGSFTINAGSSVTGAGVMIVFMRQANLVISSDSSATLSPQTSGLYAGIAMYQTRDPITLQTSDFIINANSRGKIQGTVYLPNGSVIFNGDASSWSSGQNAYVVRKLLLNADSKITIDSGGGIPGTKLAAKLVE